MAMNEIKASENSIIHLELKSWIIINVIKSWFILGHSKNSIKGKLKAWKSRE